MKCYVGKITMALPRSPTGHGTVETLKYLKGINPDLRVKFRKQATLPLIDCSR